MIRSKKLKIGFVFDDSLDRNDGVQQYIITLGKWLIAQGHEVRFLVGETKNKHELSSHIISLAKNVAVRGNQNTLSIPLPASRRKIKQVLSDEDFDVLHVQMPYNPFMAGRVVALAYERTAIIGTFHIVGAGGLEHAGSKALAWIERKTLKKFDRFLAVSNAAKDYAEVTFGIATTVSPNVVDLSRFGKGESKDFLQGENGTLVFLGRLVERKGCQHLLKALLPLKQSGELEGVRVNICGDGLLRQELEDFVEQHGLRDEVVFHGHIEEVEKADFLASADIAIFPATGGESFGIVLTEAMASKFPVVLGGDNPGYSTVLDGSEDQLFHPQDTDAFANLIASYLSDIEKRQAALQWQKKRIGTFDVVHVGAELLGVYADALATKR